MASDGTEQCDRPGCSGEATSRLSISADYDGAMNRTEQLCDDCVRDLGEWFRGERDAE